MMKSISSWLAALTICAGICWQAPAAAAEAATAADSGEIASMKWIATRLESKEILVSRGLRLADDETSPVIGPIHEAPRSQWEELAARSEVTGRFTRSYATYAAPRYRLIRKAWKVVDRYRLVERQVDEYEVVYRTTGSAHRTPDAGGAGFDAQSLEVARAQGGAQGNRTALVVRRAPWKESADTAAATWDRVMRRGFYPAERQDLPTIAREVLVRQTINTAAAGGTVDSAAGQLLADAAFSTAGSRGTGAARTAAADAVSQRVLAGQERANRDKAAMPAASGKESKQAGLRVAGSRQDRSAGGKPAAAPIDLSALRPMRVFYGVAGAEAPFAFELIPGLSGDAYLRIVPVGADRAIRIREGKGWKLSTGLRCDAREAVGKAVAARLDALETRDGQTWLAGTFVNRLTGRRYDRLLVWTGAERNPEPRTILASAR